MTKIAVALASLLVLSGCAHKELKAPCTNIAALTSDSVPCNEREPINTFDVPSVFAK